MKYILFFFIIVLTIVGCNSKNEVVTDKYENGSPKVIKIYSVDGADSVLSGRKQFYEDGKLEMVGHYTKDKLRNGKWEYYYTNGKLWSECEYKNDLKQGESTVFYENGKIHYKGTYKDDIQVGIWQYFEENGKLLKEENYKNN